MRSKTARGKSGYLLYPAAYAELVSRGLVLSHERVGLFVAPQVSSTSPVAEFSVPVPALKGVPQVVRSVPSANSSDAIYLSSMYFDPELLPREKLLSCYRSVLARPGLSSASDLQGFAPLRRIIAERLRTRGIETTPEHIVITSGSQQAMDCVCRILERRVIVKYNAELTNRITVCWYSEPVSKIQNIGVALQS